MNIVADPAHALTSGLGAIRAQFQVPATFPADVLAEAESVARRQPTQHKDRTSQCFVTLDPAGSTDLDQAFTIQRNGNDLLLLYAIADVGWFVEDQGAIDAEAWRRGATIYLPDGKAPLYPPVLSQGAVSLLADGPRPAVIFTVRVGQDGAVRLEQVERAIIQSRAKLAYDAVGESDLPPGFTELARRIAHAEDRRGASRVDPPEQEVEAIGEQGFGLQFRPRSVWEDRNAALSLATNLAVADLLHAHQTGLFRVMAPPDEGAVQRLRFTARAFGLAWPEQETLEQFQRSLRADRPKEAAFMLAIRRAGQGASYAPYREGIVPWHAAIAATYAHATAPLRRLADRYIVAAALAIANGRRVPEAVTQAFEKLPPVMARADARDAQINRAVIDLAEAVMLLGCEGTSFMAIVTDVDERGARIQLRDLPVVARIAAHDVGPGDAIPLRLMEVDPTKRALNFQRET